MIYESELSHNAAEATKNICGAEDEGVVDHSRVIRWLKIFRSRCKNLNG